MDHFDQIIADVNGELARLAEQEREARAGVERLEEHIVGLQSRITAHNNTLAVIAQQRRAASEKLGRTMAQKLTAA